jgi:hypothetical protein
MGGVSASPFGVIQVPPESDVQLIYRQDMELCLFT